jgi:UDP-N-acetylglucosamine--N-acetylmuramyl-(pentapeptide) pyrophosphoryl-undecaprenol N-acetylglucosamine transferase
MVEAAPRLAAAGLRVEITHQTGERDLAVVRAAYERAGVVARVEAFLYEVHREMKAADVVICRAGATTLAEVSASGRAAILVPLAAATDDHQRKNAAVFASAGAAMVIDERELDGIRLAADVASLIGDRERRERMGQAMRGLARPDAAERIADRVELLARGGR